ncbi:MAG: helix-turn-helix domain-containing protein [Kiritimatiellae bacterium]|nr:helix-turn-helix domain-containing protein [Kiritimatiellia bacterium]
MNNDYSKKIGAILNEIASVTQQGAVYCGLNEQGLLRNKAVCDFCRQCLENPSACSFCRHACCNAALNALSSGEPFYSECWAGLLFVTVVAAPQNIIQGGISLGGFYSPESDIRETAGERLNMLPGREAQTLRRTLDSLRPITSRALRGLGQYVMDATFSAGVNSAAFFARQNARYLQQREIAEEAEVLRNATQTPSDLMADTCRMALYLNRQDRERTHRLVSHFLAKLLMASNWDLTKLKAHLRILLAVITSQDVLRNMPWETAVNRELRSMHRLEKADTIEAACCEVADMIQQHLTADEYTEKAGSLPDRALTWIQRHYSGKAILASAARATGASVSTLAHTLRKETGKTFHQLLYEKRIAEARRLLSTTTMKLSDIALCCGFTDQSHLTRAFKGAVNLTPGKFRYLLNH